MAEKVTKMVLKVDLQCSRCYNKVKKALRKFPREIRDQVYDEKNNTVTIIVVCYSPEKIQQKLCYKADGAIKSIEIVHDKKKEPEKPKPPPAEKPKEKAKVVEEAPKPAPVQKAPEPKPVLAPEPVHLGPLPTYSTGVYCTPYQGYGWPPSYYNPSYERPVYDSYGGGYGGPPSYYASRGRPVYEGYGGGYGRGYYVGPCEYLNEENARGCCIV